MTRNQILYQQLQETKRANRANEGLTQSRDNTTRELGFLNYGETSRSNQAKEAEVARHNLATEEQARNTLDETRRSNLAREVETNRSNLSQEQLKREAQSETARSNLVNEAIKQGTLDETVRSNKRREYETSRHNQAVEKETVRSNVAREEETHRSNIAKEGETKRSNLVNEQLKSSGVAIEAGKLSNAQRQTQLQEDNLNLERARFEESKRVNDSQITLQTSQKWKNYASTATDVADTARNTVESFILTPAKAFKDVTSGLSNVLSAFD